MTLDNSIKFNEEINEVVITLEEEKKRLNLEKTMEDEDHYSNI